MSTLSLANIETKAANTPPVIKDSNGTEVGQFCRAWVNFNGEASTAVIRDSFNVSSITDHSAGDYTVNFTNAMSNAHYCVSGCASDTAAGNGYRWLAIGSAYSNNFSKTVNGVRVQPSYDSAVHYQAAHVYVVIHGN